MPPLLRPSPPPSKEPPDKSNPYLPLSAPLASIDTSLAMNPDKPQPPASPSIRPPFNPFFTLIHDTATSTTHHPRQVHYIFSDDDPSLLTSACLSTLSPPPPPGKGSPNNTTSTPSTSSHAKPLHAPNPSTSSSSTTSKSPSSSTAAAAATPHGKTARARAPDNRILLLDLDDSGTTVARAHSLSSSWQIVSTSLTPAPTWEESPLEEPPQPGEPAPNGAAGFMLKIAGTDGSRSSVGAAAAAAAGPGTGLGLGREGKARGDGEAVTEADLQALMAEFDSRMKLLRTVVEAGAQVARRQEEKGQGDIVATGEEGAGAEGDL